MQKLKNPELIQSFIRLTIGILTYIYISTGINSGHFTTTHETLKTFTLIFFGFTFLVVASIYFIPQSTSRRYISLTFDIASTTISAYLTGGINSVYILVYLWIYLGYGARYGRQFLVASVILTIIGYNILLFTEDAWNLLTLDAIAFLLLIIALPVYLYSLQKKLQATALHATQANQAKSEFLSNMTHQIRTPIGGIVGMIDLLNKSTLDTQQKQYLQALSQASNSLQEIIEDVVDFSKIEKGSIYIGQQELHLRTLINSLMHNLAPLAHERKYEFNYYISEDFPAYVLGDAQRLRQLLSNLVRYAIDNNTENDIYVHAYTNGKSTDNKIKTHIDIHFCQHKDLNLLMTETTSDPESSLALRIGSQLTRLMNGRLDVKYDKNSNPTLQLSFNWQLSPETHNESLHNLTGKRVLIFDPDTTSKNILSEYCQQLGIDTFLADGHDNLIAHILWSQKKNKHFDAIILSDSIHLNNSQELIFRIRHDTNCQTPIIYATYINHIALTEQSILHDIQATMIKPVAREVLEHTLKYLLNKPEQSVIQKPEKRTAFRLLLAEDSEINASVIYNHLTELGHEVDIATDGNTALYAMHKHHYDLVFMDLNMPNMNGIEATQQWRKLEPEARHLPIIALTAKATSDDRQACLNSGMDDFLTKPVSEQQLAKTLETHIKSR
ncbi:MAG: response regulator [Gammaproteobacteria bacterium]|nr:response regulator [Gammaproteobacteria bacterium]